MRLQPSKRSVLPWGAAFVALLLLALPAAAVGQRSAQKPPRVKPERARGLLDVRAEAQATPAEPSAAQDALRTSLGLQGVVDVDSLTGTPRVVAKLDGFLTGPSSRDAKDVAVDYVRAHPDVFLLDEEDLAGLRVTRDYTDIAGVRHIVWAQTAGGIATFDNDLRANVTADGRLLNVLGSPLPDLSERVGSLAPSLDATGAVGAALRSVGRGLRSPRVLSRGVGPKQPTRLADGHRANLVFFNTPRGVKLAWRTTAFADADEVYDTVVDAASGEVLRRVNEVADIDGLAWGYYPGATVGGSQEPRTFPAGWQTSPVTRLEGNFVHVFRDLNDDDIAGAGEQVPHDGSLNWNYAFQEFTSNPLSQCSPSQCSWDSFDNGNGSTTQSWRTNDEQNATQVFYFVNTFHDWLLGAPFGFDAASGNFEMGDKVKAHTIDGATTGAAGEPPLLLQGMPDANHLSNANMLTLPEGSSPIMQMYLFASFSGDPADDPTPDVNGGDDASVVYHEYTHGLSNRLITYSDGWGALDAWQSGAMGEAWSDWYAMDYLASHSDLGGAPFYANDTATEGEIVVGAYTDNAQRLLRTEGLDCPVGSVSASCPGTATAGTGGYSYGDFGKVVPVPEVHADGEIWAQTLWDLRDAIDVTDARFLITEAMRLSPMNPSFLDMRNAILEADVADGGTDNSAAIWQVFADRGMGFFAHATNGNDVEPTENFAVPPDPNFTGTLDGTVTDQDTGLPLAGVVVTAGNQTATTNAAGQYSLSNVPAATYPAIFATKVGYQDGTAANVVVTDGGTTMQDLVIRRDWSARSAGAVVQKFTGPNFVDFGCGPGEAIDQAHITGWSTAKPAPRYITVKLPKFVDVTAIRIDPGAVCGDPDNASTQGYRIEVSKNNVSWTKIKESSFTLAQGQAGILQPAFNGLRRGVRYVRFTVKSNFNAGQPFIDITEVAVFGKASPLCFGQPATRVGTAGANTLNGTAGADVIVGLGGNDVLNGNGGSDLLCGGDGADRLTGHAGVDKFDGGNQNDTIYSRDGRKESTVRGGAGTDRARKDPADVTSGVEKFF